MSESEIKKATKERSPAYPIIPLKQALERLERFERKFRRHPVPFKKVGLAWGVKEGSSQANSVLAALKSFGLVVYAGSGDNRTVSISSDGRTYLRAQQEEIKMTIIKRAALKPKAIAKFWPDWKEDRPPDEICLDSLVLDHGFNEKAAPTFLRVYDSTIAFAGLGDSDKLAGSSEDDEDKVPPPQPVKVGDLVQIEIDDAIKLETPKRVRAIQEHDGADWVFIEGTDTGFPMEQVVLQKADEEGHGSNLKTPPFFPEDNGSGTQTPKGHRKAVFPVSGGDVSITYPADISEDALDELDRYLQIFLKKENRDAS